MHRRRPKWEDEINIDAFQIWVPDEGSGYLLATGALVSVRT